MAMARIARQLILFENALFHVYWQCHNRDYLLKPPWAKELLYNLLLKYKDKYGMTIFSYMIMDNHVHISGQAPNLNRFSKFRHTSPLITPSRCFKKQKRDFVLAKLFFYIG